MKKILLATLLFQSICALSQNKYYFSNTGNDANNGSQSAPFASIGKFNSLTTQSGDEAYFSGTFNGTLVPKSGIKIFVSGSIAGFTDIATWTSSGNKIWESPTIPGGQSTAMIVTVDGVSVPMGRWPNAWRTYSASGSTLTDNQGTPGNFMRGTLVIRKNQYSIQKGTITAQSGSTYTYTNFPGQTYATSSSGYGYFVQNHLSTLDIQNEWYYNPTTKKLYLYSATAPKNVKIATAQSVIDLTGKSNVTISGAKIEGSVSDLITMNGASGITIANCDISAAGNCGIWGNFSKCTITGSKIHDINNFAIFSASTSSSGNNISNNEILNCGLNPGMTSQDSHTIVESAGGILCFGGVTIQQNTVRKTGYASIYFKGNNVLVKNNLCDSSCLTKDESASIYSYVGKADNTGYSNQVVDGNIVLNAVGATGGKSGSGVAAGIYMDINVKGVQITNNSIAHCATYGILMQDNQNDVVKNNTIYDCNSSSIGIWTDASGAVPTRNVIIDGNTCVMKSTNTTLGNISYQTNETDYKAFGTSDHNVIATPLKDGNAWYIAAAGKYTHFDLAQWQSQTGMDKNSTKSPKTITNASDLRFEYNATNVAAIINLGATYSDMKGKVFSGAIAPYSSVILMYQSGTVPTVYYNTLQSKTFTRNNCTSGTGSSVLYSVPAGKYSAPTQAGADQLASNDINANGQAYANTNGICTVAPPATFFNSSISGSFTKNNCTTGTGSVVVYTVAAKTYSSQVSQQDADNKAIAAVAANGQANANSKGTCVVPTPPPPPTKCSWWDKLFKRHGCRF